MYESPGEQQRLKFCIDCKYHSINNDASWFYSSHLCNYDSVLNRNLVTGEKYPVKNCFEVRQNEDQCGTSGRWFEEK